MQYRAHAGCISRNISALMLALLGQMAVTICYKSSIAVDHWDVSRMMMNIGRCRYGRRVQGTAGIMHASTGAGGLSIALPMA
ncbi:hypothetical protein OBBRIDRAFT_314122 [Obba rivulosa]|uniref:Uncharacterized protein n=1 Tax=Obba rivulosa TaxID=1052685 RepID=A0A8E2AJM1_9APHY|nr:hypothetical protein OBBRIDRAFT_314122 [Obba rivulosa]